MFLPVQSHLTNYRLALTVCLQELRRQPCGQRADRGRNTTRPAFCFTAAGCISLILPSTGQIYTSAPDYILGEIKCYWSARAKKICRAAERLNMLSPAIPRVIFKAERWRRESRLYKQRYFNPKIPPPIKQLLLHFTCAKTRWTWFEVVECWWCQDY